MNHFQGLNQHPQGLIAAASQYPNTSAAQCNSTSPINDKSPIEAMIEEIKAQLRSAHEAASMLENKVAPFRACCPEDGGSEASPRAIAPTAIEQHLHDIYETVRYLTSRIDRTTAELRI